MTGAEHPSHSHLRGPDAPEWARLEDLSRTRLLDTPSEERFDRITRLAQSLFGVSAASVSLIAENRQYLKSFVGPLSRESDRKDAFCAETLKSSETLIVENARTDERFRNNALVTGDPHIQFYAGHPLTGPGGTHVGTFCIIDQAPRSFSAEQRKILEDLTQITWDIDQGARTQRALLPVTPPAPAGYSLGVCFYPAFGLSGDFYDLGTTAAGHFRMTVGDAMGKGVGPGLVAGAARSAFADAGWDADPVLVPTDGLLDLHGDLARLAAAMTDCRAKGDADTAVRALCDRRGKSVVLDDITAVLFQRA
jgi:hypothetical protein